MARSTLDDFRSSHPPAASNDVKADDALEMAADLVMKWAPPPSPEPPDYNDRAERAERQSAAWIFDTGGYRSGYSKGLDVMRTGENFDAKGEGLKAIIRGAMGPYYKGAIVESVPMTPGFPR